MYYLFILLRLNKQILVNSLKSNLSFVHDLSCYVVTIDCCFCSLALRLLETSLFHGNICMHDAKYITNSFFKQAGKDQKGKFDTVAQTHS
jgi:hypothetical protein